MVKKEYTSVSVPVELAKKIEKYLQEEGYVSLGELVRELLRNWLRERKERCGASDSTIDY